jgi:hypothetical protein
MGCNSGRIVGTTILRAEAFSAQIQLNARRSEHSWAMLRLRRVLLVRRRADALGERAGHRLPAMPRTLHEADLAVKRSLFER